MNENSTEPFDVHNGELFCLACREVVRLKSSLVKEHTSARKHVKAVNKYHLSKQKASELVDYLNKHINDENAGSFTKTKDADAQIFNINHVIMLINNAIPIEKSDGMRENIERTGFKLSHSSHLRKMVPSILEKDLKDLVEPLKNKQIPFSVIMMGLPECAKHLVWCFGGLKTMNLYSCLSISCFC